MVTSEVDRTERIVVKENQKEGLAPLTDAWKVVGSPARRASINPMEDEPMQRARAASIPGFSFQIHQDSGIAPPPGFKENNWEQKDMELESVDEFREMTDRISNLTPDDDLTEQEYVQVPKNRSRSKSSSAIFGSVETDDPFDPKTMPDMSSIWSNGKPRNPALMHRRASTQPSQQTLMWEALRAAQLATPNDMNGDNTDLLMERFKKEHFVHARRLSVAPSMVNRFMLRSEDEPLQSFDQGRRHSMAGPMFDRKLNQSMTDGLKEMGLTEIEKIDDYFNNTESRQRAFKEAGKNLLAVQELESPLPDSPVASIVYHWPLYVVEFKAGRTDYFYLAEESKNLKISVGDLAIVEADRGKDLGKVIETNIASLAELQLYQATHIDPLVDSHNAIGKEIQPKKIYKLATANEVAMLISKNQDESKANELCQTKIRAKKLPMEIVDAEYQWDRRKLTFYFVADRRIDFRELVRELFKLYKTRIWMCAVNPSS